MLHDMQAKLWLAGRFGLAKSEFSSELGELKNLETMGLVETDDDCGDAVPFRLLNNCVICRANKNVFSLFLTKHERGVWEWICNTGYKLTISELVFLADRGIKPSSSYYGKANWQTLVNAIYTPETIFDGILIARMEKSPRRNDIVAAVFGLIHKKLLILV